MRALAAVPLLAAVLLCPNAAPAVEPPRDLADYVLFAFDDLTTKGFDVEGGAVGVNDGRLDANGAIENANALVADEVELDEATTCQDLFANTVLETGPTCGPAMPFTNPILSDPVSACGYPAVFPPCDPSKPIALMPGDELTLAPGVYGALSMKNSGSSSGILRLTGGTYVFCSVDGTRHGQILAQDPTDVFVVGDIDFGPQSFARPDPQAGLSPSDLRIFQAGTDAHAPHNATLEMFLCSPNAHLTLDAGAIVTGRFVAKTIFTERISVNHGPPPTTTSTTTAPPTTSTTAAPTTSTTAVPTTSTTAVPTTSTTAAPTTSTTAAPTTSTTAAPTTSTTAAPTTSTTAAPTTSTTAAPTTSTSAAPTTSTTEAPSTTTTTGASSTTTSTTIPSQCGTPNEECDPNSPGGAFTCPPGEICTPECVCIPGTTTSTTSPASTSTTSTTAAPSTTSTTEAPSTTTTTEAPSTTSTTEPQATTTSTTEAPSTTTSTTIPSQCGTPNEECDPSSPGGAFTCPPGEICTPECVCIPGTTTSTTSPASTSTTSTTAAPSTTSTTEAPSTTTTTEAPSTTSTTEPQATTTSTTEAPSTTTSTTIPSQCGTPNEECDPSSPGGAFTCPPGEICTPECVCIPGTTTSTTSPASTTTSTTVAPTTTSTTEPQATTTSTTEAPSTTTSTTIPSQCGTPNEECDPSSPGGAFSCPPGEICTPECVCIPGTTTSTTSPASTTTSSTTPDGTTSSTTTTPAGSSTTTTTIPGEICGNCIDDDDDGLVDFEDPDCCGNDTEGSMQVTKSVFKRRGARTKMTLRSIIGVEQTLCSLALTYDVFLQMEREKGELLCAWVPAMKFMRMGKKSVVFWDLKEKIETAKGIRDMAFTCKADGAVRYYARGPKVKFTTPGAGVVKITLAFRSPTGNPADNVCHQVDQDFRTTPGGLRAP